MGCVIKCHTTWMRATCLQGHGQYADYLAVNPRGAVPAIRLEDGRVLSESNAIPWYLRGDTPYRPPAPVESKRAATRRALAILEREFTTRPFIAGGAYSIADIALFAYAHLAVDAGIATGHLPAFQAWVTRVRSQEGFLEKMYPYSIDSHAVAELP
jgi:glutathione S-transferase